MLRNCERGAMGMQKGMRKRILKGKLRVNQNSFALTFTSPFAASFASPQCFAGNE